MASVGATGCGYEHQLESVYAALHNNMENQGFLRDDALLAVVFLTNEDDASAPPTTDLFTYSSTANAKYGYPTSYSRQTRFAIACCPPGQTDCPDTALQLPPYGDSGGPLARCQGAPNLPTGTGPGIQYDVTRYADFFTRQAYFGGVKSNPLDVLLVGIDGPDPAMGGTFQVVLSDPSLQYQSYVECPSVDESSDPPCVPVLQHSCANLTRPTFVGDPAVRLNSVIRSAKSHAVSSICESDYSAAMKGAGRSLASMLAGCVPSVLPRDGNGDLRLDCHVADVTQNVTQGLGSTTISAIPQCPGNGSNPGTTPCWRIEPKSACSDASPDGVGLTVDRAGQPAPANTSVEITCL